MGVLTWLGQKIKPQVRPVTDELGIGAVQNRWSDYPSFNLTPQRLRAILWQADQGYMRFLMELYEEMEEKDAHLAAILQTRKLAVLGMEYEIQPASEEARDQEIAQFVEEQLKLIPDFKADMLDLLDAIAKGYSACEIQWDYRGGQAVVADLEWIPAKCVSFVNSATPLIITEANGSGLTPPPWKILFHRYRGRSGDVCRGGVLRPCALPYLMKSFNWKFWAIFNEVFGMPLRMGKYNQTASEADRRALKDALKSIGTDAYAIVSENCSIEFVEAAKAAGGKLLPYEVFIHLCNGEMSKAVLGQTLTTDTSGATGTYSAGKVHEEVRQDLVDADALDLAAVLRDQLIRPLAGFNFGWDTPLPSMRFYREKEEDLKLLSETYANLATLGMPLTQEHIAERFGITISQKGETVLQSAQSPPAEEQGQEKQEKGKQGQQPAAMKETLRLTGETPVPPLTPVTQGDRQAMATAQELENLTQAAHAEAQEYLGRMLAPVMSLIESGTSLEAIQEELLWLYGPMDKRDLAVLLGQVRILAHLRGRTA